MAQFLVTAPLCEKLGMKLAADLAEKAEAVLNAKTTPWQVDPTKLERLKGEAVSRQGNILKTDLKTAANGAKTDVQLCAVRVMLLGYGRTCVAATTDPPQRSPLWLAATALSPATEERLAEHWSGAETSNCRCAFERGEMPPEKMQAQFSV